MNIGNTGFNLPPRSGAPLNASPPININDSAAIEASYNHLVRETLGGKTKKTKKAKKSSKHVRELSFQQKDIVPTKLPVSKNHVRVTSSQSTQNLDDFIARQ